MKTAKLWKPYYAAIALLLAPAAGRADVVLDWNAIMQATVSSQPPFPQARFAAIMQLAVFEAVNAITGEYRPYLGAITSQSGASPEAAAVAAAHTVLRNYFPAAATTLDAARASSLSTVPDGPAKTAGITVGEAAAAAIIAARTNDGSSPAAFFLPASSKPGQWQLTPSCSTAGGVFFHWQNVKPFGIRTASQFRLPAPAPLSSDRYARNYNEVKDVGGFDSVGRPPDRAVVARFYAAVTPVGVWNDAARQLSAALGKSLSQNARDFALLNMAMSDGAVATFETKYHYNFWRPETAIRNGDMDGNDKTTLDATFTPYIVTPCFPGYPSAHATLSNAAREVMEESYGGGPFSITLTAAPLPGVTLNYTTLTDITDDIDDARVYGGIHFRSDQDAGARLGRRIGAYVYNHNLRPAHTDAVGRY